MLKKSFILCGLIVLCAQIAVAESVLHYHVVSDPETLDPNVSSSAVASKIGLNLCEGLVSVNPEAMPVPGVAESWTRSKDGKTYTFTLRKDAKWSDGKPVVAEEFVYGFRRVADPKTAAQQALRIHYLKNGKEINEGKIKDLSQLGVKALSPHKLQIDLVGPSPVMIELLAKVTFCPIRADVVKKHGDTWAMPGKMVGNGAFILKEWVQQKHLILEPNPHYWDRKNVQLTKVEVLVVEDLGTAMRMFQAKDLDYVGDLSPMLIQKVRNAPEFSLNPKFASYFYVINTKKPPFDDARVRRALAMAMDRKTLTEKYLYGLPKAAEYGMVPLGVPGYNYPEGVPYDPKAAQKLLAEAGYPGGKGFPSFELIYNTSENHKLIAQVIQQMWKQNLGINITIGSVEFRTLLQRLQQHDFMVSRMGGVGEYAYPSTFLETYSALTSGNYGEWYNEKYVALWNAAKKEADFPKRLGMYREMEDIMNAEMPVIPIYYYTNGALLQTWVQGMQPNLFEEHNFKYVRIAKKEK